MSLGAEIEHIAANIADQIVARSGYDNDPRFRGFIGPARQLLMRAPYVVQAAAFVYAHDLESFTVDDGVGDDRPFKVATLDALQVVTEIVLRRAEPDTLETNLPPEQCPKRGDWHR
jgi:hypothetical protein